MVRYGTLGDYRFADTKEAASDIRGSKIYGPKDEKLGDIDDLVFDQATGAIVYVVVDTGGWLASRRFIVPPQEIRPSLQHPDDFLVDLSKEQIEHLPPYDGTALTSEEKWADYERRYRSKWEQSPVMHRTATDRNVSPATKQQVRSGSGTAPAVRATGMTAPAGTPSPDPGMVSSEKARRPEDEDISELDHETEITALHPRAEVDVSPNNPAYRWTTFENALRRRREEVLQSSIDNAKKAEPEVRQEERMRRKAS